MPFFLTPDVLALIRVAWVTCLLTKSRRPPFFTLTVGISILEVEVGEKGGWHPWQTRPHGVTNPFRMAQCCSYMDILYKMPLLNLFNACLIEYCVTFRNVWIWQQLHLISQQTASSDLGQHICKAQETTNERPERERKREKGGRKG